MAGTGLIDQSAIQLGPDGNVPSIRALQRVSGTGTVEASNAVALNPGNFYTIQNATAEPVVFLLAKSSGLSNVVTATTGAIMPPWGSIDYFVTPRTKFIYAEALDGLSAFDLRIWQSDGNITEGP